MTFFIKLVATVALGIILLLGFTHPPTTPTDVPEATSTPAVTQANNFPTAVSTSTPTQKTAASKPAVALKVTLTPPAATPTLPSDQLNTQTRGALVNIFCTTLAGGQFKPISGSGIVVDSRGVILTNAHVAQFFLLRDYYTPGNVDCVVRTGSPAAPAYRATLLFLPMDWVEDNANQLKAQIATGTGENDYAFLLITGPTNANATLPAQFPHLAMSAAAPDVGQQMFLAAYPAGFLSGEFIATNLYASSAFAYVTQLFSFDSTQVVDLFSIGGSIESQSGSSGGAVVNATDGKLTGVIVTATLANTTNERDLRALSLAHINRSLAKAGKGGIAELLTGDVSAKAAAFNATLAPQETKILEDVLDGQ